jgi:hypothetical protein
MATQSVIARLFRAHDLDVQYLATENVEAAPDDLGNRCP